MIANPPDNRSALRFIRFSWAYILLSIVVWWFFLSLLCIDVNRDAALSAPYILVSNTLASKLELLELRVDGLFGFELGEYADYNYLLLSDSFTPSLIACALLIFLQVAAIAAYVIPKAGRAAELPALRGIHVRGQLAVSFVCGMACTATFAGLLDLLDTDLIPLFQRIGWMTRNYNADWGVAIPVTWGSTIAGILLFGAVAWLAMSVFSIGRDRYWQSERLTLICTLLGLAMIVTGLLGMRADYWEYAGYELYLGGCFTTWIMGWFTLTWAWTCRTILLIMSQRYEIAKIDPIMPICFACGYDLRQLTSTQCPECGTRIDPRRLAEPKLSE